jgi:hypothetical protein
MNTTCELFPASICHLCLRYTPSDVDQEQSDTADAVRGIGSTARSMWRTFLSNSRNVNQSMSGSQIPWQTFQYIGDGAAMTPLYFLVRLTIFSHNIQEDLYSPNQSRSWADMQRKIDKGHAQLLEFKEGLPVELRFESELLSQGQDRP